jgi:hypothetical protein
MHTDNCVPFVLSHVGEHAVAQDAGIVDQDVEPAEGFDRMVDQVLGAGPVADVVAVGDRLAARRADFRHHLVGGRGVGAAAVDACAEIVDHDLGAVRGQHQRMLAPQSPAGAGHDRNPSFTQAAHAVPLSPGV